MFIYTGKLQWMSEGVDELLVVILPNGPARVEDDIYTFSQWTQDSKKNKKVNWFQHQPIDKVTRADNGDDVFYFGRGWYKYEVQALDGYQTLSFTMGNGSHKQTMSLERYYQTEGGDPTPPGPARIWTGKLNWPPLADNEPLIAIVPEGFGRRKPILIFWQLTVNKGGQAKVTYTYDGEQDREVPGSVDSPLFRLVGEFVLKGDWDRETEKLNVYMMESVNGSGPNIGPFDLAARINLHSHDLTPPTLPGEKVELEVHYPRAQPTLARIQAALPFPPTLVETLSQTAAFVDQAGYLAKYAVDRYQALDKSYHDVLQQIDTLRGQANTLTSQTKTLTADNAAKTQQLADLQAKLTAALDEAARKESELTAQIQTLQKQATAEQAHDAADHAALDAAHAQIQQDQAARAALTKQVVQLQAQLAQAALSIQQFQAKLTEQVRAAADLKGQLAAETAHNAELAAQVKTLQASNGVLQTEVGAAKKTLAATAEELKQAQADSDDKDRIIEGLESGLVAIKKDRDAKKKALEELQASSGATIKELQDEVAKLKAELAAATAPGVGSGGLGNGSGVASWPFPNGWPFDKSGGQGGCWPTPGDLLGQMGTLV